MFRFGLLGTLALCFADLSLNADDSALTSPQPLAVVVMDPLALPLSCPCVEGYAQRDYEKLGKFLEKKLNRPVQVFFSESLKKALKTKTGGRADLVIGKRSVVEYDAAQLNLKTTAIASLVDKTGKTTQMGLIVVPAADPATSVADLKGYRIIFGPPDSAEKHSQAILLLKTHGVAVPETLETREGCADGATAILEAGPSQRGACVISSYAAPLLEGCGTVEKGALRVIGMTEPVPFVTAFVVGASKGSLHSDLASALEAVKDEPELLKALESSEGFRRIEAPAVAKKN